MKVRVGSFVLKLGRGIGLDEFIGAITKAGGYQTKFRFYDRILYIGESGDYFVGLFLKLKSQTKWTEFIEKHRKINVRQLEKGRKLMDFNFFVVHKTSHRGLYQHYHQSCSLSQFGAFLREHYAVLKQDLVKAESDRLRSQGLKVSKALAKAKAKYAKGLKLNIDVRPDAVPDIVAQWKQIKAIDFSITSLHLNAPWFTPFFAGKASHKSFRCTFVKDQDGLPGKIRAWFAKFGSVKGRVIGIDEDDEEKIIRLQNTPDTLEELDFDDVAEDQNFSFESVEESPVIRNLLELAAEHDLQESAD